MDADLHGLDVLTTQHVRQAIQGNADSVAWVVERFTPVLLAQARYRVGKQIQAICEAEDLVNEVWAIALPRLERVVPREGRFTPVLVKYLSGILLRRLNDLLRRHVQAAPRTLESPAAEDGGRPLENIRDDTMGIVTRVAKRERNESIHAFLAELDSTDREVVILRGIEQSPFKAVAAVVGMTETAVRVRYHRVLKRLRERMDASVMYLFEDEG